MPKLSRRGARHVPGRSRLDCNRRVRVTQQYEVFTSLRRRFPLLFGGEGQGGYEPGR